MRVVVVVTGERGSGKTTALRRLAVGLADAGLSVGGVVQPALLESGARVGYEILDVATGERRPLARRAAAAAAGGCGFTFEAEGFAWAAARLAAARASCEVLVADELGRLEAAGEGHLPALLRAAGAERAGLWLLGVRADAVGALASRLGPCSRIIAPSADLAAVQVQLAALAETVRHAQGDDRCAPP